MICPKCANGGKRWDDEACVNKGWPWGRVPFAYCDCPAGKAIERIEDTSAAEGKPAAVRDAIAAGADLRLVQMPRYTNRPEVIVEIEGLLSEDKEKP